VIERPSRHRGLHITAVAFAHRVPRIRAYLHTPGWERIVATGTGQSAGEAAARAEDLLDDARRLRVPVQVPSIAPVQERGAA
jgi:hypothetical protein